jgi:Peptidase propeptide and YPEB domain
LLHIRDIAENQSPGHFFEIWGMLESSPQRHFDQGPKMKRMMKPAFYLAIGTTIAIRTSAAFAYRGQQYAHEAKVTLEQARIKALKAYPGTITDQELEKEHGGTGLRYSFDIKNGRKTYEVGIDARTGALLEHSVEGPNSD